MKPQLFQDNEPLLKHGNWLKLNFLDQNESQSIHDFLRNLQSYIDLCHQHRLQQIKLEIPSSWNKFPQLLTQNHFTLNSVNYRFQLPNLPLTSNPQFQITSSPPSFHNLLPLLKQQADYHHHLFPVYYKSSQEIDWTYYQQYLHADLAEPSTIAFYSLLESQPIGFIIGGPDSSKIDIWELIVHEQYRSQGIGTQLLRHFLNASFKSNYQIIEVETGWNQPSANLYLKHGFHPLSHLWFLNLE